MVLPQPVLPQAYGMNHHPGALVPPRTKQKLDRYAQAHNWKPWTEDGAACDWHRPCLIRDGLYDAHRHDCDEALYVKAGSLVVTAAGGATVTAEKGDVIVVAAGVEHVEAGAADVVLFEALRAA